MKNAYISIVRGLKKIVMSGFLLALSGGLVSCEQKAPEVKQTKPVPENKVKTIPFPIPQVFRDESAFDPSVEDTATISPDTLETPSSSSKKLQTRRDGADKLSSAESLSSAAPEPVFCETVPAGALCDKRDGQLYRIVTIGKQVWMAQNLNYRAEGSSCYENKAENCRTYGRLYPWTVAMALPKSYAASSAASELQKEHRGVCPEGFHMPVGEDMKTLVAYINKQNKYPTERSGTLLKMAFSWKHSEEWPDGTDRFGFSAMASGYRNTRGEYREMGRDADFWVAEESNNPSHAPYWNLYYDNDEFLGDYSKKKTYAYSVRCLRDKNAPKKKETESTESHPVESSSASKDASAESAPANP